MFINKGIPFFKKIIEWIFYVFAMLTGTAEMSSPNNTDFNTHTNFVYITCFY